MSNREIDRQINESANSPRESNYRTSEQERTDYRLALHARIVAIDPNYIWTGADLLDSARMCEESIDLDDAARGFVAARNAKKS